jgi:glycosyltransferase involved in cell wall biosynthesis
MQPDSSSGQILSFVIRTYNEAAFIGRLLQTLQDQKNVAAEKEIVIVDSESTDDTVRIAQQWPVKLIRMRKSEFDYSKALNLGIEQSRGDLIVILSAHSIPTDANWLARMMACFADPLVAGACSRQEAWPDANWREVRRINHTFGNKSLTYDKNSNLSELTFSNAASCIRRSVWMQHPFSLPAAEDREWAQWAVANNFRIVYEAGVSVYHSHNESCRQTARRAIDLEKAADLEKQRCRTVLLTLRQAAGWIWRDLRDVLRLENPKPNRFRLAAECFARAYWFMREFNR